MMFEISVPKERFLPFFFQPFSTGVLSCSRFHGSVHDFLVMITRDQTVVKETRADSLVMSKGILNSPILFVVDISISRIYSLGSFL